MLVKVKEQSIAPLLSFSHTSGIIIGPVPDDDTHNTYVSLFQDINCYRYRRIYAKTTHIFYIHDPQHVSSRNANQCHTLHAYYNIIIMHLAMGVGLYSLECDHETYMHKPIPMLLHAQSTHISLSIHMI